VSFRVHLRVLLLLAEAACLPPVSCDAGSHRQLQRRLNIFIYEKLIGN
jgi:hypothetical protein